MTLRIPALRALIKPMMTGPAALSQNEVARRLGIEPSALSRWLSGGGASYPHVAGVAATLGVPVDQLWRGKVPRRYARSVPRATGDAPEGDRIAGAERAAVMPALPPHALHAPTALWAMRAMNQTLANMSQMLAEQMEAALTPSAAGAADPSPAQLAAQVAAGFAAADAHQHQAAHGHPPVHRSA